MPEFLALAKRRDVEATVLGQFTDGGAFVVRYGDKIVGRLDMEFLHEGCPRMTIEAKWTPPAIPSPKLPRKGDRRRALLKLLGRLNVCSKEFKSRMYDGEVKGLSVIKPFVGVHADMPSDASVMRIEHGSNEGLILAEGINPFYSDLDTYPMMASVIDEAVRRVISVGGRLGQIAGLDNFCWPDPVLSEKNPDGPYKMAQLVRANKALYDVTTAFKVPPISGKDSMKNDSVRGGRKISIPPTVLFSTIAKMDDVGRAVTMYFKKPGDLVYVIGLTKNELGASEFFRMLAAEQGAPSNYGGEAPKLDIRQALAIYRAMGEATTAGLLRSSHTPTLGGLAVAFALAAVGGELGAEIDLAAVPTEDPASPGEAGLRRTSGVTEDGRLFAESNSRFVVTCAPENATAIESLFHGLPCAKVGIVTPERTLKIGGCVTADIEDLRNAFKKTLYGI